MIRLLDNAPNQPSKFKTKNWVEINDRSYGAYKTGSPIKFKTSMISVLRSSLCDYSEAYILVKRTITDCIGEVNTKETHHTKGIDVIMPIYNLIEYSDNYSKTSGSLWQYYKVEPFIDNNGSIIDVLHDPDNASLKYKQKITGQTGNDGTNDGQIMIPLKYLSNFWRTLEMSLINCEIKFF